MNTAFVKAAEEYKNWQNYTAQKRSNILEVAADLYEQNAYELMSLISREAGKTFPDAILHRRPPYLELDGRD